MSEPYRYVRFRWWNRVDLGKVSEELSPRYEVKMLARPSGELEISLYKDERQELEVKSDTLIVLLSAFRAVLSQRQAAKFSPKDMELRKKVIDLYPHERPTPFPWELGPEPKFESVEERP